MKSSIYEGRGRSCRDYEITFPKPIHQRWKYVNTHSQTQKPIKISDPYFGGIFVPPMPGDALILRDFVGAVNKLSCPVERILILPGKGHSTKIIVAVELYADSEAMIVKALRMVDGKFIVRQVSRYHTEQEQLTIHA